MEKEFKKRKKKKKENPANPTDSSTYTQREPLVLNFSPSPHRALEIVGYISLFPTSIASSVLLSH